VSCSRKSKLEMTTTRQNLAGWLRTLADSLEAGELAMPDGQVCLEGYKSLKLSAKEAGEVLRLKLSIKFPKPQTGEGAEAAEEPGETPGTVAVIRYKSLKKHMKQTFKTIGQALANGVLPPELETMSFLSDARLMTSYPGKGDEYYLSFLDKVRDFETALANQDLPALKAAHADLNRFKHDCHERYA